MKEITTQCPLCHGEINFDTTECPFCGALLAQGSDRSQLILKGVICQKCGEKNYSYDYCKNCQAPFLVKCPECGYGMKVHDTKCPACGLSIKKFNKARKRLVSPISNRTKIMAIGGSAAAALVVVILVVSQFVTGAPESLDTIAAPEFQAVREFDSNDDGNIDVWEYYDKKSQGLLSRSLDTTGNGEPNVREYYWEGGKKQRIEKDGDGDGLAEEITTHGPDGTPLMTVKYSDPQEGLVKERILYSPQGKMREQTIDSDSDGRVNLLNRFSSNEKRILAATDTGGKGFLDIWKVYNLDGIVLEVNTDSDGDGVFNRMSRYSADGTLVWEAEDSNGDGQPDKRIYYWKDGAIRWIDYDSDGDGNPDTFESYTREGKFARTGHDSDGDLRVDTWE